MGKNAPGRRDSLFRGLEVPEKIVSWGGVRFLAAPCQVPPPCPPHFRPRPHRHLQDPEDAAAARRLRPAPDLGPALLPGPEAGPLLASGPGCLHAHLLRRLRPLTLLCRPETPRQAQRARRAAARQPCPVRGQRSRIAGGALVSRLLPPPFRQLAAPACRPLPCLYVCLSLCLCSLLLGLPAVPDCPLPPSLLPCPLPAKSRTDISGSCGLCGPHSCPGGLCGSSPLGGKPRVGPRHLPLSCALLTNPTSPALPRPLDSRTL